MLQTITQFQLEASFGLRGIQQKMKLAPETGKGQCLRARCKVELRHRVATVSRGVRMASSLARGSGRKWRNARPLFTRQLLASSTGRASNHHFGLHGGSRSAANLAPLWPGDTLSRRANRQG